MTETEEATYFRHPDFRGVALYVSHYAKDRSEVDEFAWDPVDERDLPDDPDWAYVVMVGDDTQHLVETRYLEPIAEDDFCGGCGQLGCGHGGSQF